MATGRDEIIAELKRRGVDTSRFEKTGFKDTVKRAAKESFTRPARFAKDLGTNPETMANAMPGVLGTAGGLSPVPGGATMGTGAGEILRDLSLKAMNKPVPGFGQHALELGGAAFGDLTAFPAINKAKYGNQIGKFEKAAGMPAAENIPSLDRPSGVKTISGWLDDTMRGTQTGEIGKQPIIAKQVKDQVDWIYEKGKQEALSRLDKIKLAKLSAWAEKTLNETIAGRAGPAANLARSQTIRRAIGKGINALPPKLRGGIAYGAGVGATGYSVYEIMKKLLGG